MLCYDQVVDSKSRARRQGSGKVADGGSGTGKACQYWRRERFCGTIGAWVDAAELGGGYRIDKKLYFAGNG
jgi:hypothetical protein